jgi:predicted DNA-binding transcriptional regulator AlpA
VAEGTVEPAISMKFLTEKQVAEMLGLSIKTLQRWRLFGEGPEWRKFGTAVRYPADALLAWVDSAPHGGKSQMPVEVGRSGCGIPAVLCNPKQEPKPKLGR